MAVRSYTRGWPVIRLEGVWVYEDTREPCWGVKDRRPCKRCGREPTPEGHDACLGKLDGVASACCGHGAVKGWVTMDKALGIEKESAA